MVKDAKLISREYIEFVLKNIGKEKSDGIFETQFSLIAAAISSYTPIVHRKQYADIVFKSLLGLIQQTEVNADNENRIVILKNNLAHFASSDENRKILLQWREGNFELLKNYKMTIGQ
jgi:hypothetical protein